MEDNKNNTGSKSDHPELWNLNYKKQQELRKKELLDRINAVNISNANNVKKGSENTNTSNKKTSNAVSLSDLLKGMSGGTSSISGGSSTSRGITYWYTSRNIQNINLQIIRCKQKFLGTRTMIQRLSNIMKKYVNVAGKWNDKNSEIFAQWWNNGISTRLEAFDGEGLKLTPLSQGNVRFSNSNESMYIFVLDGYM